MDIILSKEPSTEDRNVHLEPPLLEGGTIVDVLRVEVCPLVWFPITSGSSVLYYFGVYLMTLYSPL
jgi:hypothetical protein